VPDVVRAALAGTTDTPGYPATYGTPRLRDAAAGWMRRRLGVTGADPAAVLPLIGAKEAVAWLPMLLGVRPGEIVGIPELAYPTYDVGARLAGAAAVVMPATLAVGPARPALLWVNSPANPTGRVLPPAHLRKLVDWCREGGTILVSDECYIEFGWDEPAVSVLHPAVCGDTHEGVLAVHSLSKRSNLAGYRAGFVAGDPALIRGLLEVRRHAGMIMPAPVQAAMAVALDDDDHVEVQRGRYAARRATLRAALDAAGFTIDDSQGGLYLWATRGESCDATVADLAQAGILVAPGDFYGAAGMRHVRVALTASDERVAAAASRLRSLGRR
jgi:succinyldiaminopimelate transaminase